MSQARPERGARPLSLPAFAAVAVAGCLLLVGRSATRSLSGDAALCAVVLAVALRAFVRARRPIAGLPVAAAGLAAVGLVVAFVPPAYSHAGTGALAASALAAVAEEALFRGVLYDLLLYRGAAVAVTGSCLLFAAIHIPFYGWSALPLDLG